ncbi:MAG: hypothetical protein GY924_08585 [Planctomycetaceae bacterium]|nr:hypothetical protein [Planctomycetaceae bacterium]
MIAKQKYNYDVGSIFCVPLRNGGYATGVVARCDHQGLVFGYFFGPQLQALPESGQTRRLNPQDAILLGQFGDIGLKNGEWKLVDSIEHWNLDDWPMPPFCSPADDENMITITQYDDGTLNTKSVSTVYRSEETAKLPVDRVMGYGAVEIRLTRLLDVPQKS